MLAGDVDEGLPLRVGEVYASPGPLLPKSGNPRHHCTAALARVHANEERQPRGYRPHSGKGFRKEERASCARTSAERSVRMNWS